MRLGVASFGVSFKAGQRVSPFELRASFAVLSSGGVFTPLTTEGAISVYNGGLLFIETY